MRPFFCLFATMKKSLKTLTLFALGLGVITFSSCSDESGDDPDPVEVITCQLTGIGEVADGESYNTTFTYDADGNLTKRSDPDGDMTFTYVDGKITTIGFDGEIATVTYDGNTLPYRMELTEDGETFYFIMKSENGRYVTIEDHYVILSNLQIMNDAFAIKLNRHGFKMPGARVKNL